MIHLPAVLAAAEEVQTFCRSHHWQFCFIGGVAVQRWGEPRLTQDVDITLLTGFGSEETFADALLGEFVPRRADAREFALQHRVLLVATKKGTPIDIAFGGFPFEERTMQRSSDWQWADGHSLFTCSAEDLVAHKIFAGREIDWSDAERILKRQHGKLDLRQIFLELKPLLELKGNVDSLRRFEDLLKKVDRQVTTN